MNVTPWSSNLWAYSLQVLILVGIGALLPMLFRLRHPRTHLAWSQVLLVACLLLPVLQPWTHPVVAAPAEVTQAAGVAVATEPVQPTPVRSLPLGSILAWGLLAGMSARALWLLLGVWRLRQYRSGATPLHPLPPAIAAAQSRVGVDAAVCVSDAIKGPVTFGIFEPIVLLPRSFVEKPAETQFAVACHEFLHVQRRDWLWTMCEEVAAVLVWFHPAVWWLSGQIRLAREQVVDREVVALTSAREPYVQALLAMAGTGGQLDLAPAPLFLRRRHLSQRVYSLLKEVSMSRKRLISSYAAFAAIVLATAVAGVTLFPLEGSAQVIQTANQVRDGQGVTVQPGAEIERRLPVAYPAEALENGIGGEVILYLDLNSDGEVVDGRVVSGPEELRESSLRAALGWHYASGPLTVQAIITYEPWEPPAAPPRNIGILDSIDLSAVSEPVRSQLESQLRRFEGQMIDRDTWAEIWHIVGEADPHLTTGLVRLRTPPSQGTLSPSEIAIGIVVQPRSDPDVPPPAPPPAVKPKPVQRIRAGSDVPAVNFPVPPEGIQRIRVGGNVQAARLISQPRPVYPPAAREARIQGMVRFNALIGSDGAVQSLTLVSGHPLLVPGAEEAVKQWVYEQTFLNGQPVEVVTTIDVNFTLTE